MKKIMLFLTVAVAAAVFTGCGSARKEKQLKECQRNLKQLAVAIVQFTPFEPEKREARRLGIEGFRKLIVEDLLCDPASYVCPASKKKPFISGAKLTEDNCSYYWFTGHRVKDVPMVVELPGNHAEKFGAVDGDYNVKMYSVPQKQTLEAYFIAALGHEPSTELERSLQKEAQDWDQAHPAK